MSIIEQAARRLEELKRAGVEVDWEPPGSAATSARGAARGTHQGPSPSQGTPPAAASRIPLDDEEGYVLDSLDDDDVPSYGAAPPSGARNRAASSAAAHAAGSALVRVGLRQSKSVQLDMLALSEQGYLVPGAPRSVLVDEFRAIKQPLLKHVRAQGEPGAAAASARAPGTQAPGHANLIMVTSALAGEGKTFCAVNLALSIASEVDCSVLLVDADVLRPAVMNRLGVSGAHKGLLDLLSDSTLELPDLILKTNVPKLSILPAGAPTSHSTELLASDAMSELLHEIATKYAERIVIFDAPPLLSTTESRVLAARMGQILMVVAAEQTQTLDLAQAYTALEHCPNVFSILNRSNLDSESRHHYGYYAD
jgi:protein-tyrosine kinase